MSENYIPNSIFCAILRNELNQMNSVTTQPKAIERELHPDSARAGDFTPHNHRGRRIFP